MNASQIAYVLSNNATTIIAANAAIIAFISTRNVHLSDRCRGITEEVLYKLHQDKTLLTLTEEEKEERLQSLIRQGDAFYLRYIGTSIAFICSAIAFILFVSASFLVKGPNGDEAFGALAAEIGACFIFVSFVLLVVEFTSGFWTLNLNNKAFDRPRSRKVRWARRK